MTSQYIHTEGHTSSTLPAGIVSDFVGLDALTAKRFPTGAHPCQGLYWHSTRSEPDVVFILSHYTADYAEHYVGAPLAQRGYGVLGWNTRYTGAEARFILDQAIEDIAVGVNWIKSNTKATKIIFIGNSGGGSLMSAYNARAETVGDIPKCDAFVFLNAHPGRADVLTNWMDPSVTDENDVVATDSTLDMYNPVNGPPYSEEFVTRYRKAQVARNARITKWAKEELARINKHGIPDRMFALHRTLADLRFVDSTIDPSDRAVPACYAGDPQQGNLGIGLLGSASSLKTWLSMWSLEDSKARFDHSGPKFTIPVLIIQSTADVGVFKSDAQKLYDLVASKDKELLFVPGKHFFEDSEQNLETVMNKINDWVSKRFAA